MQRAAQSPNRLLRRADTLNASSRFRSNSFSNARSLSSKFAIPVTPGGRSGTATAPALSRMAFRDSFGRRALMQINTKPSLRDQPTDQFRKDPRSEEHTSELQ